MLSVWRINSQYSIKKSTKDSHLQNNTMIRPAMSSMLQFFLTYLTYYAHYLRTPKRSKTRQRWSRYSHSYSAMLNGRKICSYYSMEHKHWKHLYILVISMFWSFQLQNRLFQSARNYYLPKLTSNQPYVWEILSFKWSTKFNQELIHLC